MEQYLDFAVRNWYLFVALIVIIALLIGNELMGKLRGIKAVNANQALQIINHDDAVIIDVRGDSEYKDGHIANARHIPQSELKTRLKELTRAKDKPLLLYCRNGSRAGAAANILKKAEFTNVSTLSGGITAWQNANLPISKKK